MSISWSDLDQIIFSQQWPPAVYHNLRDKTDFCHEASEGFVKGKVRWKIHGLWPEERDYWEEYRIAHLPWVDDLAPPVEPKIDKALLKPIEARLKDVFFDAKSDDIYPFLQRIYDKHGICMNCLPSTNNELKYFTKQLDLHAKYDMTKILADIGVTPGNSYVYGEIYYALEKYLGKKCAIICLKHKKTKLWFLSEIQLCFNLLFELIDANPRMELPFSTKIYYAKNADEIRNEKYLEYLLSEHTDDSDENTPNEYSQCQLI